jgi:hypothetical protein
MVDVSDEVRRGLRSLLEDGLVEAYLIHAEPPYTTPVAPEPDNMQWYWYTITAGQEASLRPSRSHSIARGRLTAGLRLSNAANDGLVARSPAEVAMPGIKPGGAG